MSALFDLWCCPFVPSFCHSSAHARTRKCLRKSEIPGKSLRESVFLLQSQTACLLFRSWTAFTLLDAGRKDVAIRQMMAEEEFQENCLESPG